MRLLAKSIANSDKETAVRQSTRHKEDIYANTSASHKEVAGRGGKKSRRFRIDLPEGKKGATVFRVISYIKANNQRVITE